MTSKTYAATSPSFIRRGFTPVLLLLVAVTEFMFSLARPDAASAHCDSVDGPVVGASRAALEADDVRLVLPYVQPEAPEVEATESTDEASRARAEAELQFEQYVYGIQLAASSGAGLMPCLMLCLGADPAGTEGNGKPD